MKQQPLTLPDMEYGKTYKVLGFAGKNPNYSTQLQNLGFTEGTLVTRGPASINDPFSVLLRGSRVALRKKEALELLIEEISHV